MLYQNDVNVVDDYLADEEDDRLNSLSEGSRNALAVRFGVGKIALLLLAAASEESRSNDRSGKSADNTEDSVAELNQDDCDHQLRSRLKDIVAGEWSKTAPALHIAALHAELIVKSHSNREHSNHPGVGHA